MLSKRNLSCGAGVTTAALIPFFVVIWSPLFMAGCVPLDPNLLLPGGGGGGPNTTPPPPTPTTLVNQTFNPLAPLVQFSPTAVGKTITVAVSCAATASRVAMVVQDGAFNTVVNNLVPTSNINTGSFTSTSTGNHRITLNEMGAVAAPNYIVTVTQSP